MNNIKFTNEVLNKIYCQLALGNGIKNILKDLNLSWEGFRQLMHKKPKVREQYELAKQDGVDYLLSESAAELKKAIEDFKANGKGDLATSHLIKEAVALTKWKASKLLPKYNDNVKKLELANHDNKPLIVKWSDK